MRKGCVARECYLRLHPDDISSARFPDTRFMEAASMQRHERILFRVIRERKTKTSWLDEARTCLLPLEAFGQSLRKSVGNSLTGSFWSSIVSWSERAWVRELLFKLQVANYEVYSERRLSCLGQRSRLGLTHTHQRSASSWSPT